MRPLDCQTCGACCVSESPHHVRVSGDDYERLADDADWLVDWEGTRAYLKLAPLAPNGPLACAALRFDQATRTFACSVYDRRPETCRDLERGSPACEGELHTKRARTLPLFRG